MLVVGLVGWLLDWLVGWLVDWLLGWHAGCWVDMFVGGLVDY